MYERDEPAFQTLYIMKTKLACVLCSSVAIATSFGQTVVIPNAFENGNTTGPGVTASALLLFGDTTTGSLGSGWNATVDLPLGVVYSLKAQLDQNALSVSGSGLAGILGSVDATKTFGGYTLDSGKTYEITISVADASLLSLLGSVDIVVGKDSSGSHTPIVDTSTGTGLLGIVDVLGLFGGTDTATFQFAGSAFGPGEELYLGLETQTLATVLGEDVRFTQFTLTDVTPVPEPSSALLGAVGFVGFLLRRRR